MTPSNPTNKERELELEFSIRDRINSYFNCYLAGDGALMTDLMALIQSDRRQFAERVLAELPKKRPVFTSTKSGSQIEVVEGKEWNEAVEACRAAIASQLSGGEENI